MASNKADDIQTSNMNSIMIDSSGEDICERIDPDLLNNWGMSMREKNDLNVHISVSMQDIEVSLVLDNFVEPSSVLQFDEKEMQQEEEEEEEEEEEGEEEGEGEEDCVDCEPESNDCPVANSQITVQQDIVQEESFINKYESKMNQSLITSELYEESEILNESTSIPHEVEVKELKIQASESITFDSRKIENQREKREDEEAEIVKLETFEAREVEEDLFEEEEEEDEEIEIESENILENESAVVNVASTASKFSTDLEDTDIDLDLDEKMNQNNSTEVNEKTLQKTTINLDLVLVESYSDTSGEEVEAIIKPNNKEKVIVEEKIETRRKRSRVFIVLIFALLLPLGFLMG